MKAGTSMAQITSSDLMMARTPTANLAEDYQIYLSPRARAEASQRGRQAETTWKKRQTPFSDLV